MQPAYLHATGRALPERVVTNADLTQFPVAMLPVIEQKTGIRERRHVERATAPSDLALQAAVQCLSRAGLTADHLGGIVIGTCVPDKLLPSTAAIVHGALRARPSAFAFDVSAVCSSAVYALTVATGLLPIASGPLLVIATDTTSKLMNPKDFSTYPYFGDGAAAVLISADRRGAWAKLWPSDTILGCDGSGEHVIEIPAGGMREPATQSPDPRRFWFRMEGRKVFDFAIDKGSMMVSALMAKAGGADAIHAVALHQANINIIHGIADRSGLPRERFLVNLDRYGNTGAPGSLLALDEIAQRGPIPAGRSVLMAVFGGGLAWAGCRFTNADADPNPGV